MADNCVRRPRFRKAKTKHPVALKRIKPNAAGIDCGGSVPSRRRSGRPGYAIGTSIPNAHAGLASSRRLAGGLPYRHRGDGGHWRVLGTRLQSFDDLVDLLDTTALDQMVHRRRWHVRRVPSPLACGCPAHGASRPGRPRDDAAPDRLAGKPDHRGGYPRAPRHRSDVRRRRAAEAHDAGQGDPGDLSTACVRRARRAQQICAAVGLGDTPPARTLSQSSVQENPGALDIGLPCPTLERCRPSSPPSGAMVRCEPVPGGYPHGMSRERLTTLPTRTTETGSRDDRPDTGRHPAPDASRLTAAAPAPAESA